MSEDDADKICDFLKQALNEIEKDESEIDSNAN